MANHPVPGRPRAVVKVTRIRRVVKVHLALSCGHEVVLFKSDYDRRNPRRRDPRPVWCTLCPPESGA